MMKTIFSVIVAVALFSCGNPSAISKKLAGSDSLVITFNVPNEDSVINTVSTTEKKAIGKLAGFLNGEKKEGSQCGFDGNMVFYNNGEIMQTVIFQYNVDSCRNFLFEIENKVMSTTMSNEASAFLKSLSSGRNWY
jgi:hypothetical protein